MLGTGKGPVPAQDSHSWVVSEHRRLDPTAGGGTVSQVALPPPLRSPAWEVFPQDQTGSGCCQEWEL